MRKITFLLLIAVRSYQAGPWAKALIAGGGNVGFMLGPWLVSRVEASRTPGAKATQSKRFATAMPLPNRAPAFGLRAIHRRFSPPTYGDKLSNR